ncbi:hypothetical protein JB92DRAFT_2829250 [Gautieria morchelliformis]|nr:hypothetical protein JB92DRAFT_2829250 [Gautieria morchelliformis]
MLTPRRSPMLDFVPTWRGIGGLYAYGKCSITLRPRTRVHIQTLTCGHVNTTTGYQLVGGTGIGDIGTQPATRRSKATVGKLARRSGRDGRAASSAAAVQLNGYLVGGSNGEIQRRVVGKTMVER